MKLLFVDCCISIHHPSRTRQLADAFLSAWQAAHPADQVERLDLTQTELHPLLTADLAAREEAQEQHRVGGEEFALARQFAGADRIAVAAPFWELSFPAQLRLYIEHIAAVGVTFGYTPHGQVGLCRAEKLLFLTTAGGPLDGWCNCGSNHWQALCTLFGIREYHFIGAPMQDVVEVDHETILQDTMDRARELAKRF